MSADGCPGVLRLHPAADGLLARVRLPGGRLDARGLDAIATGAALGSGLVELTSRAGVQLRGLRAGAAAPLTETLVAGGLLPSAAHDRVRNIVAPPLGGRDRAALAATDALVSELDAALCADARLASLPGRFLFAVDDGTGAVDVADADVALAAERGGFRLWLGGTATTRVAPRARAAAAAVDAALAFLDVQAGEWRVRDLGPEALAARLGVGAVRASAMRGARPLGIVRQHDGRRAVAALPPLGRLERDQVVALAEIAREHSTSARLSPWRTVTFVDVRRAGGLARRLEALGLVMSERSGWAGITACAGLGACARARADVRAAAASRAALRGPDAPAEHWSACERRCGQPPGVPVAVTVTGEGVTVTRRSDERRVATPAEAVALL